MSASANSGHPAIHSITSSARASSIGGTVRPAPWRSWIDDQLKIGRLLDREVRGFCSLENFVHVSCGASTQVGDIHAISHEAAQVTNSQNPYIAGSRCCMASVTIRPRKRTVNGSTTTTSACAALQPWLRRRCRTDPGRLPLEGEAKPPIFRQQLAEQSRSESLPGSPDSKEGPRERHLEPSPSAVQATCC